MNFLLDTNVISEPMKARPNAGVLAWLGGVDEDSVFLSVVTITELRYGIDRLATGRRRDRLDGWLRKDLPLRFGATPRELPPFQTRSDLRIVALYATLHAYGAATLLARTRRASLAPTLRGLVSRSSPCGQDLPLPESPQRRILRLRAPTHTANDGRPAGFP